MWMTLIALVSICWKWFQLWCLMTMRLNASSVVSCNYFEMIVCTVCSFWTHQNLLRSLRKPSQGHLATRHQCAANYTWQDFDVSNHLPFPPVQSREACSKALIVRGSSLLKMFAAQEWGIAHSLPMSWTVCRGDMVYIWVMHLGGQSLMARWGIYWCYAVCTEYLGWICWYCNAKHILWQKRRVCPHTQARWTSAQAISFMRLVLWVKCIKSHLINSHAYSVWYWNIFITTTTCLYAENKISDLTALHALLSWKLFCEQQW